ncbi:hypothetical protein SAMN04488033_10288 [Salegentibacter agarivorans]|jgi:hypothetical protein|uniref:Uncharacterized protein n=1 Tax=Salegentibacter agarivorans TaxID=345907 RepID=A0A1I2K8C9_9FLAO|nr:hypothetical protein SAMN04488033_10288 [Salegentibacter agarivorans]|tara:strand:- start:304 stop:456 length:153 start_codon:yes stop_codon:yes gene_type:complete
MRKLYTKKISKKDQFKDLNPKKETVEFLLNYSKALRVVETRGIKFGTILN